MIYKAPRGTHDIFGVNAAKMSLLEQVARVIFRKRGFEEIRTPIFEDAALFMRSIGQVTDIVEKEMYVFEDKKGRKLALRPEATASLARAFIENRLGISMPAGKFFYIGEMFRYERPQAGRYRQFHQIGGEFFGVSSPAADAEIILLAQDLLYSVEVNEISAHINSLGCKNCRPALREALVKYLDSGHGLCGDCLRRLKRNPLRVLDCKIDSHKFTEIPQMSDYLCSECKCSFDLLQSLLESAGCNYIVDNRLVRGLDYYTKTVFEIRQDTAGSREALAAGGRYDNLVEDIGGQSTPAVGFALGSERVLAAAQKAKFFISFQESEKIYIALADSELFSEAFSFAVKIVKNGLRGNKNISVFGPLEDKNLTNQLKFADKIKACTAVIFAKTEFEKGKVLVKNMKDKTQTEISINEL
ncbi:MAG: histidine--tRNA ligase [Endomicrobium sp.]|jgi:histidyl-tRNA synthetase|nr:histidine--tRNA ligase [Endomicrobium sp.]